VHGGHRFHRLGTEDAFAIQRATVEQHPAEARVVLRAGIQAAIALRRTSALAEVATRRHGLEFAAVLVLRVTCGHLRPLRIGGIKGRVCHVERIEEPLLQKLVEAHATDHLDNACRRVDA
jgi:hypothetical protein